MPLNEGVDDETYSSIYRPVIDGIMENYKPNVVVVQCGADSISGDRLGCFNLSVKGHGACVEYVKRFHLPMMVLGGGGYTMRNVARAWSYETGIILNEDLPNGMLITRYHVDIPENDFIEYFCPEYRIHMPTSNMENMNPKEYLNDVRDKILDNLKHVIPVSPMSGALGTSLPNHLTIDPSNMRQAAEDANPEAKISEH